MYRFKWMKSTIFKHYRLTWTLLFGLHIVRGALWFDTLKQYDQFEGSIYIECNRCGMDKLWRRLNRIKTGRGRCAVFNKWWYRRILRNVFVVNTLDDSTYSRRISYLRKKIPFCDEISNRKILRPNKYI